MIHGMHLIHSIHALLVSRHFENYFGLEILKTILSVLMGVDTLISVPIPNF